MQCLWVKNDKIKVINPFVRFIEGVDRFNFEIVSKTPNMVFFYVSMAFSVGITPKHAKYGIYILLYSFHVLQSIYLKKKQKIAMFIVKKLL